LRLIDKTFFLKECESSHHQKKGEAKKRTIGMTTPFHSLQRWRGASSERSMFQKRGLRLIDKTLFLKECKSSHHQKKGEAKKKTIQR
jgi:hypothetical protein